VRVGLGVDFHRFAAGRRLVLGGVEIPFERGLEGHSDADVLTHAVCDALLGAAGLGDIGLHFPPGEPEFKDVSSLELLKRVAQRLRERGWVVENVDAVLVLEAPKVAPHLPQMKAKLAGALGALGELKGERGTAVIFSCNHCPYVKAYEDRIIELAREYQPKGIAFVLINANDPVKYPEDSFENMKKRAREKGYPFPYLWDETQEVAKAYGAERTPEVFLFDGELKLRYHGTIDDN